MSAQFNLRVVIACVSFETVKIVWPIKYYKADKVYLLHKGIKPPYDEFVREVKRQLEDLHIPYQETKLDIFDFKPVMKEVLRIIRLEKTDGNHVYINVGAGPQVFCAAALIASMTEGALPFNVGVKEFMIEDYKKYYMDGRPVGLAKSVHDPIPLPEFEIKAPKAELVRGLRIWADTARKGGLLTPQNIMKKLAEEGQMGNVCDERGKVTHTAVMQYRRNFLEPWIRNGWVKKETGRRYVITEKGKLILEIFL